MKNSRTHFWMPALRHIGFVLMLGVLGLFVLMPSSVAADAATLSVDELVQADGSINLKSAQNGTVDLRGWNVTLDPQRGPVLSRGNAAPAANDAWTVLPGNGLDNTVYALAVYGNALYVGGTFAQTFDGGVTNLNHIAKFDGSNWSALPHNGLNSTVYALAVYGNALYVGGGFSRTFDGGVTDLNNIAKFDGTNWSALSHHGLNTFVGAMTVFQNALYLGGFFSQTFDGGVTNLNHIAKFDGTNWSALPKNGLDDIVTALGVYGNALYAGGVFTQTGDNSVTNLNYIAKFDGTSWSTLPHNGLNKDVDALQVFQSALYVGGQFTQSGDGGVTNLHHIAKFDGTSWSVLPHNGLNGTVYALGVYGNALYVGGSFSQTGDNSVPNLNHIAKFDGTNWSALSHNGLNDVVYALATFGNALYMGGDFSQTFDGSVTNLHHSARLDLTPTQTGPTFTVNTNADTDDGLCDVLGQGNGNKDCTLREAINAANLTGVADTITFSANLTINLNSSLPTLEEDATIDGGTHRVILDGGNAYRIMVVHTSALTLNHLTLRNGYSDTSLTWGKSGSGVYNDGGSLKVYNSTFENNNAVNYGGAIFAGGTTLIVNSTFHTNTALQLGGAVLNVQPLTVKNSTFSYGEAPAGGGIYNQGTLTLLNSILANSSNGDCTNNGTIASAENNLIESTGGSACGLDDESNWLGTDPKLAGLADNGGVTETFALLTDSPAIDAGDNTTCADADVNNKDQRGVTRPLDGDKSGSATCDIGSYEAPVPTATQTGPTFIVNNSSAIDDHLCDAAGQGFSKDCTLEEAINAANADSRANTITFSQDMTLAREGVLPTIAANGALTIDGGAHTIVLDATQTDRIFIVHSGATLNLNHLTLRNGLAFSAINGAKSGGAIYNDGGTLNVSNSTFDSNTATGDAGAIQTNGKTTISNSTFNHNVGGKTGGVSATAALVVLNSTFSNNSGSSAGGILFSKNLTLINTILGNSTGADCRKSGSGKIVSEKNNLIESKGANACGLTNGKNGDIIGVDPKLGTLGAHGGPTQTIPLVIGSRALDSGDKATCAAAPVSGKDQRGTVRPAGKCDRGAFEFTPNDCTAKPAAPKLLKPANKSTITTPKVQFQWTGSPCAQYYAFVYANVKTGVGIGKIYTTTTANLKVPKGTFNWSVQGCNTLGCTMSKTFKFTH